MATNEQDVPDEDQDLEAYLDSLHEARTSEAPRRDAGSTQDLEAYLDSLHTARTGAPAEADEPETPALLAEEERAEPEEDEDRIGVTEYAGQFENLWGDARNLLRDVQDKIGDPFGEAEPAEARETMSSSERWDTLSEEEKLQEYRDLWRNDPGLQERYDTADDWIEAAHGPLREIGTARADGEEPVRDEEEPATLDLRAPGDMRALYGEAAESDVEKEPAPPTTEGFRTAEELAEPYEPPVEEEPLPEAEVSQPTTFGLADTLSDPTTTEAEQKDAIRRYVGEQAVAPPTEGEIVQGLTAGGRMVEQGLGSVLYSIGQITGWETLEGWGGEQYRETARETERAGQHAPRFLHSLDDPDEFADWMQYTVSQGLATSVPSLIGGLGGFLVGGPPGAVIGAGIPSYTLSHGELRSELEHAGFEGKELETLTALGALPLAALELATEAGVVTEGFKRAARRKAIREFIKFAGKSGVREGVTEMAQELTQHGIAALGPHVNFADPALLERLIEAGAGGFAPGAVMGGMGGVARQFGPSREEGYVVTQDRVEAAKENARRWQRYLAGKMDPTLLKEAYTDVLTGLDNRRGKQSKRQQVERREGTERVEWVADADNFKVLNDRLGHEEGDRALQVIADALREATREDDVVSLARDGGDEFSVTLDVAEEMSEEERLAVLERIESRVNEALAAAGYAEIGDTEVGFSMGFDDDHLYQRKRERGVSRPRTDEEQAAEADSELETIRLKVPLSSLADSEIEAAVRNVKRRREEGWERDLEKLQTELDRRRAPDVEDKPVVLQGETFNGPEVEGPVGRKTAIKPPTGEPIQARYKVVDARDLTPSHNAFNFNPNPAYPQVMQPRDYTERANKGSVERIEREFDPDFYIDATNVPATGPSQVTPQGHVVGGNNRIMSIQRLYQHRPEKGDAFRRAQRERAAEFGLDPEAFEGIEQPVIVREITDPDVMNASEEQLAEFGGRLNEDPQKATDPFAQAATYARRLEHEDAADVLEHFIDTVQEEETLRSYLSKAAGRDLVQLMVARGVIPAQQEARYFASDGSLTDEAKTLVERVLDAAILQEIDLLKSVPKSHRNKFRKAVPAILRAAQVPGHDIRTEIQEALKLLRAVRNAGGGISTVEEYFTQQGLGLDELEWSDRAREFAKWFEDVTPTDASRAFRAFAADAARAEKAIIARQSGDLFGEQPPLPDPAESFNRRFIARDYEIEGDPEIPGLYGSAHALRTLRRSGANRALEYQPNLWDETADPEGSDLETRANVDLDELSKFDLLQLQKRLTNEIDRYERTVGFKEEARPKPFSEEAYEQRLRDRQRVSIAVRDRIIDQRDVPTDELAQESQEPEATPFPRTAIRGPEGEVIVGRRGQIHVDLAQEQDIPITENTREDHIGGGYVFGFADEQGRFLTRDEAHEYAPEGRRMDATFGPDDPSRPPGMGQDAIDEAIESIMAGEEPSELQDVEQGEVQGALFGGAEPAEGGDQFSMFSGTVGQYTKENVQPNEREALKTINRLRDKIDRGEASRDEKHEFEEAIDTLNRSPRFTYDEVRRFVDLGKAYSPDEVAQRIRERTFPQSGQAQPQEEGQAGLFDGPEAQLNRTAQGATDPGAGARHALAGEPRRNLPQSGELTQREQLPTPEELERTDVKSVQEIINDLADTLRVPIRVGKHRFRRSYGVYKVLPQAIRTKWAQDLETTAHEVGHHLHTLLFGEDGFTPKGNLSNKPLQAWRGELDPLAAGISDESLVEGEAEFFRRFVTNPEAAREAAPEFYAFVVGSLTDSYPGILQALQQARDDYQLYRESDPEARVDSNFTGELPRLSFSLVDLGTHLAQQIWDVFAPWRRIQREYLGGDASDLSVPMSKNFAALFDLINGSVGMAEHWIEDGQMEYGSTRIVGPSLKEILAPVSGTLEVLQRFERYATMRRVLERHGKGYETGFDPEDARIIVERYHGRPEFRHAFDQLQVFRRNQLKYMVAAGVLSERSYNAIIRGSTEYMPLYPASEQHTGAMSGGQAIDNIRSAIGFFRGSSGQKVYPLTAIVQDTYYFMNLAHRQRAMNALINGIVRERGIGWFIENVATPVEAQPVSARRALEGLADVFMRKSMEGYVLEEELEQVADMYEFLPDDVLNEMFMVFRPGDYFGKENMISYLDRNGNRHWFEVQDEQLWEALRDRPQVNQDKTWLGKLVRSMHTKVARALRVGATAAPVFFASRNVARDAWTAYVQSLYGVKPGIDHVGALASLLQHDEWYRKFRRAGGEFSAVVDMDRDHVQDMLSQLEHGKLKNVLQHPIESLRALSALTENLSRIAEFKRALQALEEQGMDAWEAELRAAHAARDIVTDFARHGAAFYALRMTSAFWNAHLVSWEKMVRTFRNDPVGFSKRAFLSITLTSGVLFFVNKENDDYWELPQWMRDTFWHIPLPSSMQETLPDWLKEQEGEGMASDVLAPTAERGETVWLRVAKPHFLGQLFGTLPERFLEYVHTNDPHGLHESLKEMFAREALSALLPVPTLWGPLVENFFEYDLFRQRNLIPESLKNVDPEEQFLPSTSYVSRMIGDLTNTSPIKWDNAMRGFGGTIATDLLRTGDWAAQQLGLMDERVGRGLPGAPWVGGAFSSTPAWGSESVDRFYGRYAQSQQAYNTARKLESDQRFDEMAEYRREHADKLVQYETLRKAKTYIDELSDAQRTVGNLDKVSPEEKRSRWIELEAAKASIARAVLGRRLPSESDIGAELTGRVRELLERRGLEVPINGGRQ